MSSDDAAAPTATSPSRSRVRDLAQVHEQAIDRANQQPVSPTLARKSLPSQDSDSAKAGAAEGDKVEQQAEGDDKSANKAAAGAEAAQSPKSAGADRTLETVPEGKAAEGDNTDAPAAAAKAKSANGDAASTEASKDGAAAASKKEEGSSSDAKEDGADKPVEEETQPLARILEALPSLGEKEQQVVQANLERVATYPAEMPLNTSWTLHFSDTSGTKSASAAAVANAYAGGITPVFAATTVPGLCGSLKAFKQAAGKVTRRAKAPEGDSFGLTRPGMNLHFFRTGIQPTWEDPYNQKGGRLTISPSAHLFDSIYERLILLLAGSALELSASDLMSEGGPNTDGKKRSGGNAAAAAANGGAPVEGMVNGVVASRRARGDRIEVWLGGKESGEPAPGPWIDALKEVLSEELGLPEVRTGKYKKHF
ncbi:hypothetical protein JCM10908_000306 [Rhodotorula pacifica]|uniref:eukaryotic translation initiation factor 4E n=1 Tax=Rhodotorula pacifica TaxID=1495444 RepID=UPI00317EE2B0